jgi:hypothetical protein
VATGLERRGQESATLMAKGLDGLCFVLFALGLLAVGLGTAWCTNKGGTESLSAIGPRYESFSSALGAIKRLFTVRLPLLPRLRDGATVGEGFVRTPSAAAPYRNPPRGLSA